MALRPLVERAEVDRVALEGAAFEAGPPDRLHLRHGRPPSRPGPRGHRGDPGTGGRRRPRAEESGKSRKPALCARGTSPLQWNRLRRGAGARSAEAAREGGGARHARTRRSSRSFPAPFGPLGAPSSGPLAAQGRAPREVTPRPDSLVALAARSAGARGGAPAVGPRGAIRPTKASAPDGGQTGGAGRVSGPTGWCPSGGGWAVNPLLTTAEAAVLAGVTAETVRKWVASGALVLAGRTPGGHMRFRAEDVQTALVRGAEARRAEPGVALALARLRARRRAGA